ncbi:uncharacterized protein EDB91DRAFT_824889 [Suillus paluster]|uniref:uncharacterized protein n=1 Tax=Suillus paluster TaxID=48578 RepID=UPI001B88353B|nr:uncharacterized protein EDB91DRAFT_824889 [Suillus paluster]KAG1748951.1 hypothetical protein EDB91DRAFT_824889 [Suillus paluster]
MVLVISWATIVTLRAISSAIIAIGLVLTVFRLTYRVWLRRFWVEDAWAVVAFLCGIAMLTSSWTYVTGDNEDEIISFWIYSFSYPSVVWAVRESILFSIVRIVYATQHLRRLILGLGVLFLCLWAGLVAQRAWQYGHNTSWYNTATTGKVHAYMSRPAVTFELIVDCLSDAILIVLPLRLLWSLKLPKRQRRMILAIFSSGIVVTIVSIFRGICQIARYGTVLSSATSFQIAMSLLVCNLLVVVTFLYRIFGFAGADDGVSSDDEDYSTQRMTRTMTRITPRTTTREAFTTVELSDLGSGSDERRRSNNQSTLQRQEIC